jgi:EAL domain-containing protein (putative c-di-GMP-specific phosphodiesterase class I)
LERAEELAVLRALGCDAAQGYFIARPMAPADVSRWLHEQQAMEGAAAGLR